MPPRASLTTEYIFLLVMYFTAIPWCGFPMCMPPHPPGVAHCYTDYATTLFKHFNACEFQNMVRLWTNWYPFVWCINHGLRGTPSRSRQRSSTCVCTDPGAQPTVAKTHGPPRPPWVPRRCSSAYNIWSLPPIPQQQGIVSRPASWCQWVLVTHLELNHRCRNACGRHGRPQKPTVTKHWPT